jgi:hypothetical protein
VGIVACRDGPAPGSLNLQDAQIALPAANPDEIILYAEDEPRICVFTGF